MYIKIFQEYIINTDIPKNVTESKCDYVLKKNSIIYQITTTTNQKINKHKNISTINFENCEKILRTKNSIDKKFPLIILKIDYHPPDTLNIFNKIFIVIL